MKYYVFIDESGSITEKRNNKLFSVGCAVISENNYSKVRNWFKRKVVKEKKKMGVDLNDELKAHTYVLKHKQNELISLVDEGRKYIYMFSSFIFSDKNTNPKWFNEKNLTYNFMVKCIIQKIIDKLTLSKNDEIEIFCDYRSNGTGTYHSLNDYLKLEFIFDLEKISSTFVHSDQNWGIQLADFISWNQYHETKHGVKMWNKRKIY